MAKIKLISSIRHYKLGIFICFIISIISIFHKYQIYSVEIIFESDLIELSDISDADISCYHPRKLIFFHETSSNISSEATITLNSRQACAIESAAKLNPNSSIFLIIATLNNLRNTTIFIKKTDILYNQILSYPNVKVRRADLENYTKDTPLEEWYHTGKLQKSKFLVSHTSDVMRYLTLWKYGGTYLDLDVVVIKNLDELGENFAAVQSDIDVAAGALNFDFRGYGHVIVDLCVRELKLDFRGDIWAHNGPGIITKILKLACDTQKVTEMTETKCNGFKVFPASSFYPIPYQNWRLYFDPEKIEEVSKLSNKSYGIHVWNKLSSESRIKTDKDVGYTITAKQFCPNVYSASGKEF